MTSFLEVRHLRLVRAIAEEGGPTRAGARLHLSQSAVSHQLAQLEGRLGVPLFTRVRRQLKLTSAGTQLLAAARTLLTDLARLERGLRDAGAPARASLRLTVESFTSYYWLPRALEGLAADHPFVDVSIVLEARREPVVALLRGGVDMALVSTAVRDRELVVEPLFEDEWAVILHPRHPLCRRNFVTPADLGRERLLTPDAPRSDVERLRELIAAERAPMPRTLRVPLIDALIEMIRAGLGVGLLSRWAVAPSIARGDVIARRFTRNGLAEKWRAVYRRDAMSRLPLEQFASILRHPSVLGPVTVTGRPRRR